MPHYRCPACRVTTHSVGGHLSATTCPNCSLPLAESDRVFIEPEEPRVISCELSAEPEAAGAARRALATLMPDPDDAGFQIAALLTTELIANSVEHSGAPPSSPLRLDVAVTDQRVRIEVRDQGEGFIAVGRSLDSSRDLHWGLRLVDRLATSWGVSPEARAPVWFELDRPATLSAVAAGLNGQGTAAPASDRGGTHAY